MNERSDAVRSTERCSPQSTSPQSTSSPSHQRANQRAGAITPRRIAPRARSITGAAATCWCTARARRLTGNSQRCRPLGSQSEVGREPTDRVPALGRVALDRLSDRATDTAGGPPGLAARLNGTSAVAPRGAATKAGAASALVRQLSGWLNLGTARTAVCPGQCQNDLPRRAAPASRRRAVPTGMGLPGVQLTDQWPRRSGGAGHPVTTGGAHPRCGGCGRRCRARGDRG